jgi:hypothetical protein
VIYTAAGKPVYWSTNTAGNPGDSLVMQTDADVVVYNVSHNPVWADGVVNSVIDPGETLSAGQYIESSGGNLVLTMQSNGDLVETGGSQTLWSSGTQGNPGAGLFVQSSDGNVVIYSAAWKALWNTNTVGNPGDRLQLLSNGALVVYAAGGAQIWSNGIPRCGSVRSGRTTVPNTRC